MRDEISPRAKPTLFQVYTLCEITRTDAANTKTLDGRMTGARSGNPGLYTPLYFLLKLIQHVSAYSHEMLAT
jgi:hypothetical protein